MPNAYTEEMQDTHDVTGGVNPLAEDKVYIVWTISGGVSECLWTGQNYLLAESKVDEYNDATEDDVYLTTVVLGVSEVIDTETEREYPENILYIGGVARIERG